MPENRYFKQFGIRVDKATPTREENGTIVVTGKFTSDNKDMGGDIITRGATERAVPLYRQWGNIRRMHLPEPVGKVEAIGAEDGLEWNEVRIRVISPQAVFEVENGLLQALSVGILIQAEDIEFMEDGGWIISDYTLAEISLVDHPANYDARLDAVASIKSLARQFGTGAVVMGVQSILDEDTMEKETKDISEETITEESDAQNEQPVTEEVIEESADAAEEAAPEDEQEPECGEGEDMEDCESEEAVDGDTEEVEPEVTEEEQSVEETKEDATVADLLKLLIEKVDGLTTLLSKGLPAADSEEAIEPVVEVEDAIEDTKAVSTAPIGEGDETPEDGDVVNVKLSLRDSLNKYFTR